MKWPGVSRNPSNYYGAPWRQPAPPIEPVGLSPVKAEEEEVVDVAQLIATLPEPSAPVSATASGSNANAVDPLVAAVNEQRRVPREARR